MVDALASFFSSLTEPKRTTSRQSSCSSPPSQRRRSDEREEDGFVFLGNTRTERNQRDSSYQGDAPPTYDDSQNGLPTFQEVMADRQHSSSFQPASVPVQRTQPLQHVDASFPTSQHWHERASQNTFLTAQDIPFELSPEAQVLMDCADSNWSVVAPIARLNPAQYDYDFSHERAVIAETNAPSQTQSSTSRQGRTHFNATDDRHSRHDLMSFD